MTGFPEKPLLVSFALSKLQAGAKELSRDGAQFLGVFAKIREQAAALLPSTYTHRRTRLGCLGNSAWLKITSFQR